MKKKLFTLAGIGFAVGAIVGILISVLTTVASVDGIRPYSDILLAHIKSPVAALLLQILFSGLYGAICMGGTVVYDVEEWSLLRVSLTHYLMCMISYLPISLLLGWNNGIVDLLIACGVMTAVYFIIWLCMFLRYRAQVRELNDIKQRRKDTDSQNTKETER